MQFVSGSYHLLQTAFQWLVELLWYYPVYFIAVMFMFIILRIIVSYVFWIFKLNHKYRALQDKQKYYDARDRIEKYNDQSLF